jgi:thiol-disulfide isomerase/thioredoxin
MFLDRIHSYRAHIVSTLCIAAFAWLATPAGAADIRPTLVLDDLGGTTQSLVDRRGSIVVINFWATWCLPCLEELPLLESLSTEYAKRGIVFIAASSDDASTSARIPAAIDEAGVTFPVWSGATTLDMERFGVGTGVPATVVVDRDGSVAFRVVGLVSETVLRERLDWLTSVRDSSEPETIVDAHVDAAIDGDAHDHDHAHEHDHGDEHAFGSEDASLVPS